MLRCLNCGKHEKWNFEEWPIFECPDCGDSLIWIDPKLKKVASLFCEKGFQVAYAVCGKLIYSEEKIIYIDIGFRIPYPSVIFRDLPSGFIYYNNENYNTNAIVNSIHNYVHEDEMNYCLLHYEAEVSNVIDELDSYHEAEIDSLFLDVLRPKFLKASQQMLRENILILQDWIMGKTENKLFYKCMKCGLKPSIKNPYKTSRCPVCNGRLILTDHRMEKVSNSFYQHGFDISLALGLITKLSDNPRIEKVCIEIIFNKAYPPELFNELPIGFELLPTNEDKSLLCFETEINSEFYNTNISLIIESHIQKLQDWINGLDENGTKAILLLSGLL